MKRLATAFVFVFLGLMLLSGSFAYCETPPKPPAKPPADAPVDEEDRALQMKMRREKILEERQRKQKEKEEMEKRPAPEIKMVFIKGGCYQMGDFVGDGDEDERPAHEACVGDLYMAETEVTVGQWNYVMYDQQFKNVDPNLPVTNVDYYSVNQFLTTLNKMSKKRYRLPTEAEWEYAARERGRKIRWAGTDDEYELTDYAWFNDNSDDTLHPVKQKKPNSLGLYDMSGNAAELVDDYFDFDFYKTDQKVDPYNGEAGNWKVARGGASFDSPFKCRTTYRYSYDYLHRSFNTGFRLSQ